MQIVTISGVIGRNAAVKTSQSGREYLAFSVAVQDRKDAPTIWFDVLLGKTPGEDPRQQYYQKGARVLVSGRLQPAAYIGKNDGEAHYTLTLFGNVAEIQKFPAKGDDAAPAATAPAAPRASAPAAAPAPAEEDNPDNDLPF